MSLTATRVRRMRTEAIEDDDRTLVELCDLALGALSDQPYEDEANRATCERALADLEALT